MVKRSLGLLSAALLLCVNTGFAVQSQKVVSQYTKSHTIKNQQINNKTLNQLIPGSDYQLLPLTAFTSNQRHRRYQQTFRGIPVWGHQIIVHKNSQGQIQRINGDLAQGIEADLSGIKAAISDKKMALMAREQSRQLYDFDATAQVSRQQIKSIIYLTDNDKAVLAYYVEAFYQQGESKVASPALIMDGDSGAVLAHWNNLKHAQATGPGGNEKTGRYEYGEDFAAMTVTEQDGLCLFENENVRTVDLKHQTSGDETFSFPCSATERRNEHEAINGAFSPLNDAHTFGTAVFNLFNDWYDIAPLPFQLLMKVHYGHSFSNAFWDGRSMTFGDGGQHFYPLVSLDIVAHEVSHGFTEQHSALLYRNQSGGVNEAFSDIAGEAAEFFHRGSNDWLAGRELMKNGEALRYFADPTLDGISIGHADNYVAGMDVHYSSGVFNRAFYLLANTPGWGMQKAFDVMVDANRFYWTNSATFVDAACGVIFAATDRQYNPFEVHNSFLQVGVSCDNLPVNDVDGDGIVDFWEWQYGLDNHNPNDAGQDSDNDGLTNLAEFIAGTNPMNADSDNDGLADNAELTEYGSDPLNPDTDGDQLTDGWEISHGLNPLASIDGGADSDSDGFSNLIEFRMNTDPQDMASFPVALSDSSQSFELVELPPHLPSQWLNDLQADAGWLTEEGAGTDGSYCLRSSSIHHNQTAAVQWSSLFAAGYLQFDLKTETESDGDNFTLLVDGQVVLRSSGVNDWAEQVVYLTEGFHTIGWVYHKNERFSQGADAVWIDNIRFDVAAVVDADADGLADYWELFNGFAIDDSADALADFDHDGLTNLQEFELGTDPRNIDSDGDGVADGWEVQYGLSPLDSNDARLDHDGDGVSNLDEFRGGSSPLSDRSVPRLTRTFLQSFEHSGLPIGWQIPALADQGWQPATDIASDGTFSLRSMPIADAEKAVVELQGFFLAGELQFDVHTNTEGRYDVLQFLLDGEIIGIWSGRQDWKRITVPLNRGFHLLSWQYVKDASLAKGEDAAWIDNVSYTIDGGETDSDGDGLPDFWESYYGLDPQNITDAVADFDQDGLTNFAEFQLGTSPINADSDNDGLADKFEIEQTLTDPLIADSDGDGVIDGIDALPLNSLETLDTDGDGIGNNSDGDDDGDGIPDIVEIANGLDPLNGADANEDADNDGFSNLDEFLQNSGMLNMNSVPASMLPWLNLLLKKGE